MYNGLDGSKGRAGMREEARKHGTYSGVRCGIVEHWFILSERLQH
jgi:hypothetical protein